MGYDPRPSDEANRIDALNALLQWAVGEAATQMGWQRYALLHYQWLRMHEGKYLAVATASATGGVDFNSVTLWRVDPLGPTLYPVLPDEDGRVSLRPRVPQGKRSRRAALRVLRELTTFTYGPRRC